MKQKDILFILASATLVVLLWIVFNVVHNTIASTITQNTAHDITQIPGIFDLKTLQKLEKRTAINAQTAVTLIPSPTPTVVPITPVAPIQELSIPIASQGGKTQ